jgi:hypothetical protein
MFNELKEKEQVKKFISFILNIEKFVLGNS